MITMGLGTLAMLTWGLGNALRPGRSIIIGPPGKVEFRDKPSGEAFTEKPSGEAFVEKKGGRASFSED